VLREKALDEFLNMFLENKNKAEVDIDFWKEDKKNIKEVLKGNIFEEEIRISKEEKKKIPKRTWVTMFLILVMIPITVWIGITYLNDRKYLFISLIIVIYSTIPFFMIFESRKPKARELVIIATLSAIAVAGRGAFFMLPSFKPVAAIVIISAVCFGGESGFLVGAVSMIVSNMFMGQGPWSPWQMFAMGIIGFIAGILFNKGWLKATRGSLCIYGFWSVFIIYGGIMNPASLVMMSKEITWKGLLAVYISGVPVDLVHATATVIFLWIISKPMIEKLERIKVKYGLIEGEDTK
jgi:energy-coupling factor transport system substrate-specific component